MTGPNTPNLPTIGYGYGGGSVSGVPWQLVEVNNAKQAISSPTLPYRSTPPLLPAPALPEEFLVDDDDAQLPEPAQSFDPTPGGRRKSGPRNRGGYNRGAPADYTEEVPPEDDWVVEDGFDPRCLVGDWMDNLGHRILVTPSERSGRRQRRNGRGGPPPQRRTFLAVLQKVGVPDKRFNISKDRYKDEWTCGNGILVRDESGPEGIVWQAEDGRKSSWTRTPPEGPVIFDPPPMPKDWEQEHQEEGEHESQPPQQPQGMEQPHNGGVTWLGPVMYVVQMQGAGVAPPYEEWKDEWKDSYGEESYQVHEEQEAHAAQVVALVAPTPLEGMEGMADPSYGTAERVSTGPRLNADAPEFVPGAAAALLASLASGPQEAAAEGAKLATPLSKPASAPASKPASNLASPEGPTPARQGPAAAPPPVALPPAPTDPMALRLFEESPDVKVDGRSLDWYLPDTWEELSKVTKDCCIASPMFGVPRAEDMQLIFYPNGQRTAAAGHCTVGLRRESTASGPMRAVIEFELFLNGRASGPKVVTGRRYLGDFLQPYQNTEENNSRKVRVSMRVLDVLPLYVRESNPAGPE